MPLKPTVWEDEVSQNFVNEAIKYIEEEADLKDIDYTPYDYSTIAVGKFQRDVESGKRDVECGMKCKKIGWNFHDEKNTTERMISNTMYKLAIKANNHFRFDLNHNRMTMQLARWDEGESYFQWHADGHVNFEGESRKLAFSLFLKPAEKGGQLLINTINQFIENTEDVKSPSVFVETIEEASGKVVAFPAYCNHCVTPVEKGNRYSLVAWIFGPEWK
jgi:predicted 2-oxoglutarate/Fe(II)-dependent dioxygenase YbiX